VTDVARPAAGALVLSDILGLVGEKLRAVEEEVGRNLRSDIGVIDELGSYLANGGGKRRRPAIAAIATSSSPPSSSSSTPPRWSTTT
jgi:geranylgeranyl pyrophosphate synthase